MAQFRTATIAAALFCLFAVSLSRAPPQIDESAATTLAQLSLPLSDADLALRLPSELVNTEADAKATAEVDSDPDIVTSVPMTELTFRPINRRFHVRSKRPCRHHFKFYHTMRENEAIPYGNDMILPSGENSDFEEPIVRGGGNRIPGRWMRLHHHHHHLRHRRDEETDSDNEEDVGRMKKVVLKRDNFDRFDREKKLKKLREQFRVQKEEEEKSKKSGFMKGVRKFLDHYI